MCITIVNHPFSSSISPFECEASTVLIPSLLQFGSLITGLPITGVKSCWLGDLVLWNFKFVDLLSVLPVFSFNFLAALVYLWCFDLVGLSTTCVCLDFYACCMLIALLYRKCYKSLFTRIKSASSSPGISLTRELPGRSILRFLRSVASCDVIQKTSKLL